MKLNKLFMDHMVFQAGKPIRVFGEGDGTARVEFLGETKEAASQSGKWMVELETRPYGGPYELTVTLNGETAVLNDVYVGEVILYAGQSNVTFDMREEVTPESDYVDDDLLREFYVLTPERHDEYLPGDMWTACTVENTDQWSALGWLTGRRVREKTGAAVGIVMCAQGASVIQSWMPEEDFKDPRLYVPKEQLAHNHSYPDYMLWNGFSCLYHYSFETIVPYSYGSVVWYQGESNAGEAESRIYLLLLEAMMNSWRRADLDETLPFIVVQIADLLDRDDDAWHRVQAQQSMAASLPYVSVVECRDVCENTVIHPPTKGPLADRITAKLPLAK